MSTSIPPETFHPLVINELLAAATRTRYTARSFIVHEGQASKDIYYVLSGSVSVFIEDADGHTLILSYLGPGSFFGELGLFQQSATRSAWVSSRTECEIARVSYDRFRQLIHKMPELLAHLTGQLAERLRATNEKLGNLAFLDVTGRIARVLLDLSHDSQATAHPEGVVVRVTHVDLGRMVNCSPQMVARVLHNLEEQGLIQLQGRSIIVRTPSSEQT